MPVERARPPGEGPCTRSATQRRPAEPRLGAQSWSAGCLAGLLVPATAHATPTIVVNAITLSGGSTVSVGDTGQGQITLRNASAAAYDNKILTLTALTLVPSCGEEESFRRAPSSRTRTSSR